MLTAISIIIILTGIYLLAKSFGFIGQKTAEPGSPAEAQKVDLWINRGLGIAAILLGIYLLSNPVQSGTQSPDNPPEIYKTTGDIYLWGDELKSKLIQQCMENGKATAERHPQIAMDYCKCATDKISISMRPEEYQELITKPAEEQQKVFAPLIEPCVKIMQKLIELSNESGQSQNSDNGN